MKLLIQDQICALVEKMTSVLTVYLNEFASADLSDVVVVWEGHAQLASFHEHGSL